MFVLVEVDFLSPLSTVSPSIAHLYSSKLYSRIYPVKEDITEKTLLGKN